MGCGAEEKGAGDGKEGRGKDAEVSGKALARDVVQLLGPIFLEYFFHVACGFALFGEGDAKGSWDSIGHSPTLTWTPPLPPPPPPRPDFRTLGLVSSLLGFCLLH